MSNKIGVACDIPWFAERDIDVWLSEELRINSVFARWFLDKLEQPVDVSVPAYRTRISVCEGRETDVEAFFLDADGRTFAVLIEDKIKADFQPNQMEDYVKRGDRGVKEGRWDRFAVVVFAPSYRMPFSNLPKSIVAIKFEEAANEVRPKNSSDGRLHYRAAFLERAAQPRVFVAGNENEFISQWWTAVNELVFGKFGDFFRPQIPRKTTYVNPRCADQEPYLRLDLKGNQGKVALAFMGFSETLLRSLVTPLGCIDMQVVREPDWKDPVIQLVENLEKYDVGDEFDHVRDRILAAYGAAHKAVDLLDGP